MIILTILPLLITVQARLNATILIGRVLLCALLGLALLCFIVTRLFGWNC
ncbi:hypothetical protein [Rhizobium leguminosarum]|nr:hypothetical protein [Rhizobium leguminosarum]